MSGLVECKICGRETAIQQVCSEAPSSEKCFTFNRSRFNDHPVAGSRTKRSEVRRLLVSLTKNMIWSELHGNMQKDIDSADVRNTTDIPFYTTPTVVLDDFLARKGMATQFGKKKVNGRFFARGSVTGNFAP